MIVLLPLGEVVSGTFTTSSLITSKLRMEKGENGSPEGKGFSAAPRSWPVVICKHLCEFPPEWERGKFKQQEFVSDKDMFHQLPSKLSIFLMQQKT